VNKIKEKTFNLYKKEKRIMEEFLGEESETITMATQNEERANSRAKSLLMNYNRNFQMQKISERQEYDSKMNSTRMKKDNPNQVTENIMIDDELKRSDEKIKKELTK
jgi:hypothetical protein